MSKPYHTLIIQVAGIWEVVLGDHDRDVVEAEVDYYDDGRLPTLSCIGRRPQRSDCRIITTARIPSLFSRAFGYSEQVDPAGAYLGSRLDGAIAALNS